MLGLAKVDPKSQISKADMELLHSSGVFSATKPLSLKKKVFFEIMLYFYLGEAVKTFVCSIKFRLRWKSFLMVKSMLYILKMNWEKTNV